MMGWHPTASVFGDMPRTPARTPHAHSHATTPTPTPASALAVPPRLAATPNPTPTPTPTPTLAPVHVHVAHNSAFGVLGDALGDALAMALPAAVAATTPMRSATPAASALGAQRSPMAPLTPLRALTPGPRLALLSPPAPAPPTLDPHNVTVRLLNLAKPGFAFRGAGALPLACGDAVEAAVLPELRSGMLTLQPSCPIYAGEAFRCYLSLANASSVDVARVWHRVEVQGEGKATSCVLSETRETPITRLCASESKDFLLVYLPEEAGTYTLSCTVAYYRREEERVLRKAFKFRVGSAVSVRTKVHESAQTLYVEAAVTNDTGAPLTLGHVRLATAATYMCTPLSLPPAAAGDTQTQPQSQPQPQPQSSVAQLPLLSSLLLLAPGTTMNFVFRLTPKDPATFALQQGRDLGRVHLQWYRTIGNNGRCRTKMLYRRAADTTDAESVQLRVYSVGTAAVEQPFALSCELLNRAQCEKVLSVAFVEDLAAGLLLHSTTAVRGRITLGAGEAREFNVDLLPVREGVHQVPGVVVTDHTSNKRFDFMSLGEVLVER
eukprot:TRINITY_DN117_c2_g1_i1.p1 TRINITY_DN117_c2_g1~~TRINITY_DN117_c2_g1_i1.p1  ORF type:complete len:551 (+),score=132.97 TRINITY_DN117_c2_g1_i1:3-1655(+)